MEKRNYEAAPPNNCDSEVLSNTITWKPFLKQVRLSIFGIIIYLLWYRMGALRLSNGGHIVTGKARDVNL